MAKRGKKGSSILGIILGILVMLVIGGILFAVVGGAIGVKSDSSSTSPEGGAPKGDDPAEEQGWLEWLYGKLPDVPGVNIPGDGYGDA